LRSRLLRSNWDFWASSCIILCFPQKEHRGKDQYDAGAGEGIQLLPEQHNTVYRCCHWLDNAQGRGGAGGQLLHGQGIQEIGYDTGTDTHADEQRHRNGRCCGGTGSDVPGLVQIRDKFLSLMEGFALGQVSGFPA